MDNVIAAMEAAHPHLTSQNSFDVEISRARDRAELVTDDAEKLREHLERATGERISALEGIGAKKPVAHKGAGADRTVNETPEPRAGGAARVRELRSDLVYELS